MTELYRGLLLVLTSNFNELISTLRSHVRSYKSVADNTHDPEVDFGVNGFWNLILEVIFTLYILTCVTIGVLLTVSLAIIAYPFAALFGYTGYIYRGTRETQLAEKIPPTLDNETVVVVKKDVKEKE